MNPIQLTDPCGRVFTYACGVCFHHSSISRFGHLEEPPDADLVQSRREDAERCCTCRRCRGEACPSKWHSVGVCAACGPAEDELIVRARAESNAKAAVLAAENEQRLAACPDAAAARELVDLMSDISEDCYCAGWLSGLEESLWAILAGGDPSFGMGEVDEAQRARLCALSTRCDGWWRWNQEMGGELFVRLDEWKATR